MTKMGVDDRDKGNRQSTPRRAVFTDFFLQKIAAHQRDGALRILFGTPCDQRLRPPDSSIGSVCEAAAAAAAAAIAADGNADSDKCLMCDRGDLMAAEPLPVSATPPGGPARSIELPSLLILDLLPESCKCAETAYFDRPESNTKAEKRSCFPNGWFRQDEIPVIQ